MHRPWNSAGSERLMGTFVLLAFFIVASIVTVSFMSVVTAKERAGSFDYSVGYEIVGTDGEDGYFMRNPTAGFNITGDNITEAWNHDGPQSMYFTEEDEDTLEVAVVMDNVNYQGDRGFFDNDAEYRYLDFVMIYTEYGWWSNAETSISFDNICEWVALPNTNLSVVPFELHNDNYGLFIRTPSDGANHTLYVQSGVFNLRIGELDEGLDYANLTAWDIITNILTLNLPGTHPVIDLFMMVAVWSGIAFMVFTVISRITPWVAGG